MSRPPVAILSSLLLVLSACAVSSVSNTSKVVLTEGEMEETAAAPQPQEESTPQDPWLQTVKENIVNVESTRTQAPALPTGTASPLFVHPQSISPYPR